MYTQTRVCCFPAQNNVPKLINKNKNISSYYKYIYEPHHIYRLFSNSKIITKSKIILNNPYDEANTNTNANNKLKSKHKLSK